MTQDHLNQLENQIGQDRTIFNSFGVDCSHITTYMNQQNFKFLPGHRFSISSYVERMVTARATNDPNESIQIDDPAFTPLLREMIRTSLNNYGKLSTNNRFTELLMNFSIYIYIMAGKSCYEVICANLPLPKAGTIRKNEFKFIISMHAFLHSLEFNSSFISVKHIQKDKDRIIEGELRCKQLVDYLERINAPKCVFLSEDGSGIIQKIVYDAHSNQLVGLMLPFNDNGMPEMFSFEAKTAEEIEQYIQLPQSTLVYIVVAQPLKIGAAPFILQLYGTNNTFTTTDVLNRWVYTASELNK